MCGRFSIVATPDQFIGRYSFLEEMPVLFKPIYNGAPLETFPVITNDNIKKISYLKWGLVPFWAKDDVYSSKMINARAETIDEKPSFYKLIRKRRCIIPATSFFEWKTEDKLKVPYLIKLSDQKIFSMAGLWDVWLNSTTKEKIKTFTIMTTEACSSLKAIHNRMPVILSPQRDVEWLEQGIPHIDLMQPYDGKQLIFYKVSKLINNPKNKFPGVMEKDMRDVG